MLSSEQTLGGSERHIVGFVFVLKFRNVKRKNNLSYFFGDNSYLALMHLVTLQLSGPIPFCLLLGQ